MRFKVGDRLLYCNGDYDVWGGKAGFEVTSIKGEYYASTDCPGGLFVDDDNLALLPLKPTYNLPDIIMALELANIMVNSHPLEGLGAQLTAAQWLRAQALNALKAMVE